MAKHFRINDEIRADQVRMIDAEGNQLGIIALKDALAEAARTGLDLVEVAPNSSPPVCRLMDYGKYRYQQTKKLHQKKKSQTTIQVKEIRLRPKTEEHDMQTKLKHIRRFLDQNNKVKVTMLFRGREIIYADRGAKIMEAIKSELEGTCTIDKQPSLEGRNMIMIVSPKK